MVFYIVKLGPKQVVITTNLEYAKNVSDDFMRAADWKETYQIERIDAKALNIFDSKIQVFNEDY